MIIEQDGTPVSGEHAGGALIKDSDVANFVADVVEQSKTVPVIVKACQDLGWRLKQMRDLFPAGYHRGASKIAGISHAFIADINAWLTYETPISTEVKPRVEGIGFLQNFDD